MGQSAQRYRCTLQRTRQAVALAVDEAVDVRVGARQAEVAPQLRRGVHSVPHQRGHVQRQLRVRAHLHKHTASRQRRCVELLCPDRQCEVRRRRAPHGGAPRDPAAARGT